MVNLKHFSNYLIKEVKDHINDKSSNLILRELLNNYVLTLVRVDSYLRELGSNITDISH